MALIQGQLSKVICGKKNALFLSVSCLKLMEMIRMLNMTQSSVVSCHIKFTIRLSSPFLLIWPAPMHFISLFNCVEKCCQKKNRAWYTEYSKQIMTA